MTPQQKAAIGLKILTSKMTRRPRPFFVQYSLLNGCNARCAYCNSPARDPAQLPTDTHEQVLGELARLGTVRIKFLGGEPLLRSDIGRLIRFTKRLGMRAAMVTNGFLILEKFDDVRELDELIISIDGREQAHDRQRGSGTWARVMAAIEACAAARIEFFLSAVVTRDSMDEIDWLIATARRLGVMVNFQIPQFNLDVYGAGARQVMPDAASIRAILTKVIAEKENGAPILFTTRSYRQTLAWRDYAVERMDRPGEPSPCTAGRYFLQIEPNGDVYPCVLHIGGFQPKNVVRDGVEAAWRHAWTHHCGGCYNTWLNENRGVFALHPSVVGNFWRHYLVRRPAVER
jgi:MoaA/NifB/PqqE/SkfB family radical SAM enzyme